MKRDANFIVRLTQEEKRRLERVAAHHGQTMVGVLRMLVKNEDERIWMKITQRKKP